MTTAGVSPRTWRNSEKSLKKAGNPQLGGKQGQRNGCRCYCGSITPLTLMWPTGNPGCRLNWIFQKIIIFILKLPVCSMLLILYLMGVNWGNAVTC